MLVGVDEKTKVVVLLGPPGSGKGTQAKLLAEKNVGYKHLSTGDLFRAEIASDSPLGRSVKEIIAKGQLVTDEKTNEIFKTQLEKILAGERPRVIVLDGYPRNEKQVQFLLNLYKNNSNLADPQVVELVVPELSVVKRLSERLLNPRNGRIYHKTFNPPKVAGKCDEDGGPLVQRPDDEPATIRKRYQLYIGERNRIVDAFGGPTRVKSVVGDQGPQEVYRALTKVLSC